MSEQTMRRPRWTALTGEVWHCDTCQQDWSAIKVQLLGEPGYHRLICPRCEEVDPYIVALFRMAP